MESLQNFLYSRLPVLIIPVITFRVSRRRREMYCGHASLCVCLSACLFVRGRMPILLHGPRCNLGNGRGCPLVVHYWADSQSVHGLRCYGNITRMRNVSEYVFVLALCLVYFFFSFPVRNLLG